MENSEKKVEENKVFRVFLEFVYDKGENIEDWNLDGCNIKEINTISDAVDVARAEIANNDPNNFEFDVELEEKW